MKRFFPLAVVLVLILSFFVVSLVACEFAETEPYEDSNSEIYAVYAAYAENVTAAGGTPLDYEVWLASIKGEKGDKGDRGDQGIPGKDGANGSTPYIDENGNWWIDKSDTGISATGGKDYFISGKCGDNIVWSINSEGTLVLAGAGDMFNYNNQSQVPWGCFDTCIRRIEIDEDITSISNSAFSGCSNLESITLPFVGATKDGTENTHFGYIFGASDCGYNSNYVPSSLKTVVITGGSSIGYSAFYHCYNLTSITIPSSVESIENDAFLGDYYNPMQLTSITFEEGSVLKSIGYFAFYNCSNLTSITIPSNVESIGDYAFTYCFKLVEVCNLSSLNITKGSKDNGMIGYYAKDIYTSKDYTSKRSEDEEGYIIYTDGEEKSLIGYRGDKTELTIPSGITEINQGAFYRCNYITSITIPSSVESIGNDAFEGCEEGNIMQLASVIFEEGSVLNSIGYSAFYYCSNLTSIIIPSSVESIGDYAFSGCSNLTSITIPSGVESIGDYAFSGCYKLVEVCNLSSLKITEGSEDNGYIGYYAKDIYTSKDYTSKLSEDAEGYIIYTDGEEKSLIGYTGDKTELILPTGITKIYQYAFYDNDSITSITIPNSVESIGNSACEDCSNLTSITIPSSVEYIGAYAFSGCNNLSTLTFEDTSNWYKLEYNYDTIEQDVINWQNKTNGTVVASWELSYASSNAVNFKNNWNYRGYYWYKKDAE